MPVVGLTGGIGSGKSTVSAALADRGATVLDADAIVRELQAPGQPVLAVMVEEFGPGILNPDGSLNRPAVADIVFNDEGALNRLNEIVHPAVRAEMDRRIAAAPSDEVLILDIPLLLESGRGGMDLIVVVDTNTDVAVSRLVADRGFDEADARARIAAQTSREERRAISDFVIDNSGPREALVAQLDALWARIAELGP